ncbi:MAG: hypothetical protein IKJ52_07000 [Muribaculaceae bacterium]|nr:hypothetical protein [Muribaculaceae bacterium]
MGIEPMFDPKKLAKDKARLFETRFEKALVYVLNKLGMELVNTARESRTYTDRTSNLTNSIGYVVLKKGAIVSHGGEQKGKGENDKEGELEAISLYKKLSQINKYDYSLAIVAGMNYAAYVEAKGYNVLLPAELKANLEFRTRMAELIKKTDNELKRMLK